jgi:C4-dicarboxylate-specific signal transduction histidine kinase
VNALFEFKSLVVRWGRFGVGRGQLTASIAHEVNQPISATVINAKAALRWLDRREPDLDEVRQALASIVKDGAEAISRIRDLIKKNHYGRIALRSTKRSAR